MATYAVREVILGDAHQTLNASTLPGIIAANDPMDGSTLAGFLLLDANILLIVWMHT